MASGLYPGTIEIHSRPTLFSLHHRLARGHEGGGSIPGLGRHLEPPRTRSDRRHGAAATGRKAGGARGQTLRRRGSGIFRRCGRLRGRTLESQSRSGRVGGTQASSSRKQLQNRRKDLECSRARSRSIFATSAVWSAVGVYR